MKKRTTHALLMLFLLAVLPTNAQKKERPKLVVGVVIDQMRYDYLYRFYDKYSDEGFKKLIKKGFHVENTHFNYIPTATAVGHSSIFTGTTPQNHGILANHWYDVYLKKQIYCVDDARYNTVGTPSKNGQKSPHRLQTTTIGDQLRLAQNMRGKTIGISMKDRSAILSAGHTANASYWYDGGAHGKWISSSFYITKLPKWVQEFNANGNANRYLNQIWEPYAPLETYTESIADDNPYEGLFNGEKTPTFPHDLPKLRDANKNFDLLMLVPFGNNLTTDFARAAIVGENLGKGPYTDMITISYSSTDKVGHMFGIDSKEIQDTYLRMDLEIAKLLAFLDKQVGKEKYTLFLTADHAAVQVPNYLKKLKIPGGYFNRRRFEAFVKKTAFDKYGSQELIENISNHQIFLDKTKIKDLKLNLREVESFLADEIISYEKIYKVVTAHSLQNNHFETGLLSVLQQGYNQKFSGQILYIPNPGTLSDYYKKSGTSHGTGYSYDTHVPLLFYGKGIKKGASKKFHPIVDIAPTLANLLQIEFPNGNTGKIIEEALK